MNKINIQKVLENNQVVTLESAIRKQDTLNKETLRRLKAVLNGECYKRHQSKFSILNIN